MYATNIRAALKSYISSVEATLSDLSELESIAEVFSNMIETNREINLEVEDSIREVGYLEGQREELYNEYHESTFSGNAEKVAEVEEERDRLDARLEELHEGLEDLRSKIVVVDGEAVREMLAKLDDVKLPIFQNRHLPYEKNHQLTGLADQLEYEHKKLAEDVGARVSRIREMHEWSRYIPKKPETPAEMKLRVALAAR